MRAVGLTHLFGVINYEKNMVNLKLLTLLKHRPQTCMSSYIACSYVIYVEAYKMQLTKYAPLWSFVLYLYPMT